MRCSTDVTLVLMVHLPAVKKATRVVLPSSQGTALPAAPLKRAGCQASSAAVSSSSGTTRTTRCCKSAFTMRWRGQGYDHKTEFLP